MCTYRLLPPLCLFTCSCLLMGCGASDTTPVDVSGDDDTFLKGLLNDFETDETETTSTASTNSQTTDELVADGGLAIPAPPVASNPAPEELRLRLETGDRFPLVKTIRQNLVQTSADAPANAESQLELHMVIQVDDLKDDAILMNVRYTRVRYGHTINGQSLQFDSDANQSAIPADVVPYAGMVNNGFSFWLGLDNKIKQLVGYQDFLQKCVERVPVERRETLLSEIAARFGDDGVANFVDDTVGLLPYNPDAAAGAATKVVVGDVWSRERRLMHPMPVYMKSTCRLLSLNDKTAEIDITGQIANAEVASNGQSAVQIRNGRSIGSCVIDRATGLPLKVNRSRYLTMTVTASNGKVYEQEKRIETTIQTFPNVRGPVVQVPGPYPAATASVPTARQQPQLAPVQALQPPVTGLAAPPQFGVNRVSGVMPPGGQQPIRQLNAQQPRPQLDISTLKSEVQAVYPD